MFESLSDRLNGAFTKLQGKGRLDEADIDEAMKEVRRALLEADVNFKVVASSWTRSKSKPSARRCSRASPPRSWWSASSTTN